MACGTDSEKPSQRLEPFYRCSEKSQANRGNRKGLPLQVIATLALPPLRRLQGRCKEDFDLELFGLFAHLGQIV